MTTMTATELTDALAERGIAVAASQSPLDSASDRPWFISAVLGAAGWVAGVFLLVFAFLLFEPETAAGIGLAGAVLLIAAYGLYFAGRGGSFLEQLALALSIAGQIGLCIAAAEATESAAATAGLTVILQLVLLVTLSNSFAKTLAAFFACVAWALTLRLGWWDRSLFGAPGEVVALAPALLGWVAIWVPVIAAAEWLVRREIDWLATGLRRFARPALSGAIGALAVATWLSEPFAGVPLISSNFGAPNWLALWPLLGTGAALYAAACAFRLRSRALLGLAIAGALVHAMQFYYVLGTSLVVKSAIMVAVGTVLLAAAWTLRRVSSAAGAER
jgi:hypothetical protein